jgi:chromosome segregation ATPase
VGDVSDDFEVVRDGIGTVANLDWHGYGDARAALGRIKARLHEAEEERDRVKREWNDNRAKAAEAFRLLDESQARIAELEQERDEMRELFDRAEAKAGDIHWHKAYSRMWREVEKWQARVAELEQEKTVETERWQKALKETQKRNARIAELEQELRKAKERAGMAMEANGKAQQAGLDAETRVAELEQAREAALVTFNAMKARLREAEEERVRMTARAAELERHLKKWEDMRETWVQDKTTFEARVAELEQENIARKKLAVELTVENTRLQEDLDEKAAQVSDYSQEIEKLRHEYAGYAGRCEALTERIAELEQENVLLVREAEEQREVLVARLREAEERIAQWQQLAEKGPGWVSEDVYNNALRRQREGRDWYQAALSAAETRVAELEQELREARRKAMPRYGMKLEQENERLREHHDASHGNCDVLDELDRQALGVHAER